MLKYKSIEIFTSEDVRWRGSPLQDAVVDYIRGLKKAARVIVTRGIGGCYESGELATNRLEILSYNMPLRIYILLPEAELDIVLPRLTEMVTDGVVVVHDMEVVCHKTQSRLIPRQMRVGTVMSKTPRRVRPGTPLDEVASLLLSSVFSSVPVVDDRDRPVGIVSQEDLIYKAGLPLRMSLLDESDLADRGLIPASFSETKAQDIMARPAVTVGEGTELAEAVKLMVNRRLRRLPVVNSEGKLTGMLSRIDVFRAIAQQSPKWGTFKEQKVCVENLRQVSDIMRCDIRVVLPEASIQEVLGCMDGSDIQRIAVVDRAGRYLGVISDQDLLTAFSDQPAGIWEYLVSKMTFTEAGRRQKEFLERVRAKTAAEVMNTDHTTIVESATIDEAVRVMTEEGLKRLPVIDSSGLYKGIISRESLLRTALAQQ